MKLKKQNKKQDPNHNRSYAEKERLFREFESERDRIYNSEGFYAAAAYTRDYILKYSGLPEAECKAFTDVYDYMEKYSKLGRPTNLRNLKTYLEDVKGYDNAMIVNILPVTMLIMACGFDINA